MDLDIPKNTGQFAHVLETLGHWLGNEGACVSQPQTLFKSSPVPTVKKLVQVLTYHALSKWHASYIISPTREEKCLFTVRGTGRRWKSDLGLK